MLVEVVALAVVGDVLPGLLHADRREQVREPVGVRGQEQEHVLVLARLGAAVARELERSALAGAVVGLARVGVLGAEDHQRGRLVVLDVRRACRQAVDAGEVTAVLLHRDPGGEFVDDLAVVVVLGRRAGDLANRRLCREPVPSPLMVEEGRALGQSP